MGKYEFAPIRDKTVSYSNEQGFAPLKIEPNIIEPEPIIDEPPRAQKAPVDVAKEKEVAAVEEPVLAEDPVVADP